MPANSVLPPDGRRDALVFVPGLGGEIPDQSIDGIALRVAAALGQTVATRPRRFSVLAGGQDEVFAKDCKAPVRTVVLRADGAEKPVVDVYKLEYSENLVRVHEKKSLAYKILAVTLTLLVFTPKIIGVMFRKTGKTFGEKCQLLYAASLALLLAAYLVVLGTAAVGAVGELVSRVQNQAAPEAGAAAAPAAPHPGDGTGPAEEKPRAPAGWWSATWVRVTQAAALVGAVVALAVPRLPESISRAAALYLCAINYTSVGDRRPVMTGQLLALLQHVSGKEPAYNRVHVVGYSFGAIIALDTLLPPKGVYAPPAELADTLVTIGAACDLIRTYAPNYFNHRDITAGARARWVNVYSPADLLGSNFSDKWGDTPPEPDKGIKGPTGSLVPDASIVYREGPSEDYGFFGGLLLLGLRAHTVYWEREFESDRSCFPLFLPELFTAQPPPPAIPVPPTAPATTPGQGEAGNAPAAAAEPGPR